MIVYHRWIFSRPRSNRIFATQLKRRSNDVVKTLHKTTEIIFKYRCEIIIHSVNTLIIQNCWNQVPKIMRFASVFISMNRAGFQMIFLSLLVYRPSNLVINQYNKCEWIRKKKPPVTRSNRGRTDTYIREEKSDEKLEKLFACIYIAWLKKKKRTYNVLMNKIN